MKRYHKQFVFLRIKKKKKKLSLIFKESEKEKKKRKKRGFHCTTLTTLDKITSKPIKNWTEWQQWAPRKQSRSKSSKQHRSQQSISRHKITISPLTMHVSASEPAKGNTLANTPKPCTHSKTSRWCFKQGTSGLLPQLCRNMADSF